MNRISLAIAMAVICSPAFAQNHILPAMDLPVRAPVEAIIGAPVAVYAPQHLGQGRSVSEGRRAHHHINAQ